MNAAPEFILERLARDMSLPGVVVEVITQHEGRSVHVQVSRPAKHVPTALKVSTHLATNEHPPRKGDRRQALKAPSHGIVDQWPRELVNADHFTVAAWNQFLRRACARGLLSSAWLDRLEAVPEGLLEPIQDLLPEGHPRAAEKRVASASLNLAALIAAGVREQARAEWAGEQVASQSGETTSAVERMLFSIGLIRAALRIRLSRMATPGIELVDRIIRSEAHTCRTVGTIMFLTTYYVFHTQGLTAVIGDGESLLAEGGALYGLARWRRKTLKDRDEISGEDVGSDPPASPPE